MMIIMIKKKKVDNTADLLTKCSRLEKFLDLVRAHLQTLLFSRPYILLFVFISICLSLFSELANVYVRETL